MVTDCINYIEMIGLDTEGIFRRSVAVTTVRNVQKMFNEGVYIEYKSLQSAIYIKKTILCILPSYQAVETV